MIQIYKTIYFG